jgi:hypothetical protein
MVSEKTTENNIYKMTPETTKQTSITSNMEI